MSTFLTRLDAAGDGPRLAVKDAIDVAGVVTTVGSPAVADTAVPAAADAACLSGARSVGARIVGKTNLHELCFGLSGVNPWYGTPVNPLDPALVPGGSSSGSAVAVATGEADVALGTDTGGSVRVPSACCGTTGLKTTFGRVPLEGVWPLAPSLDTVGPMARDIAGVVLGMELLDPGFAPADRPGATVGRIRRPEVDPVIDAAVDAALARAGIHVVELELPGWEAASEAFIAMILGEAWHSNRSLFESSPERIGHDVAERLRAGQGVGDLATARDVQHRWQAEVSGALSEVDALALPTLASFPPPLDRADTVGAVRLCAPFNLSGHPVLAVPVAAQADLPASLQLVGPLGGEELLVTTGALLEGALGSG